MRWNHQLDIKALQMGTSPKISIEPEHDGLEDYFPPGVYSKVPC